VPTGYHKLILWSIMFVVTFGLCKGGPTIISSITPKERTTDSVRGLSHFQSELQKNYFAFSLIKPHFSSTRSVCFTTPANSRSQCPCPSSVVFTYLWIYKEKKIMKLIFNYKTEIYSFHLTCCVSVFLFTLFCFWNCTMWKIFLLMSS
jgi:hypothetical protein